MLRYDDVSPERFIGLGTHAVDGVARNLSIAMVMMSTTRGIIVALVGGSCRVAVLRPALSMLIC